MEDSKYIIFGAGYEGKNILHALGLNRIAAFCDNFKAGESVEGIPVISFEALQAQSYPVIIGVQKQEAADQIMAMLQEKGIPFFREHEVYHREGINAVQVKQDSELDYWQSVDFQAQNLEEIDAHYRDAILAMTGEKDDTFLKGKVIADFGCGPMGSLHWIRQSALNIGIDVLAARYTEAFGAELIKQNMVYVNSGEEYIPMPDESVDCLITMNSLDHVANLDAMCNEIFRILKTGGLLIGSFNMYEPATACEPQTLTVKLLKDKLLGRLHVDSIRFFFQGQEVEENFFAEQEAEIDRSKPGLMQVTATK